MASIVDIVHEIEDDYGGTVDNAPDSDPRFQITHKVWRKSKSDTRHPNQKLDLDDLRELWEQGMSDQKMADELGFDCSTVVAARSKYLGEPNRKKWIITRGKEKRLIENSIELKKFFATSSSEAGFLKNKALELGWKAVRVSTHDDVHFYEADNSERVDKKKLRELWEQGLTDNQIADELNISSKSVYNHRAILGKSNRKIWRLTNGKDEKVFITTADFARYLGLHISTPPRRLIRRAKHNGWKAVQELTHDY